MVIVMYRRGGEAVQDVHERTQQLPLPPSTRVCRRRIEIIFYSIPTPIFQ